MRQTLSPENVLRIGTILNIMHGRVTTNIALNEAADYIPYIVEFEEARIKSEQLPGVSELTNGVWIFVHNEEETQAMVRELFFNEELDEEEETDETV